MENTKKKTLPAAAAVALVALSLAAGNALACTEADPCEMTLYAMPDAAGAHIEYGDTFVLQFDGEDTKLIPSVAAWKDEDIELEPTVKVFLGITPADTVIVPAWEFDVESEADEEHEGLLLYKDPKSDDWFVEAPENAHGRIHGGTAHMR